MNYALPRVVADTNLFVSYVLNATSPAGRAFDRLLDEATLLVSADVLAELRRVLARPKFDRFTPLYNREIALERYVLLAELIAVTHTVTDCRDPTDNKFLALALSGRADLILTGVPSRY